MSFMEWFSRHAAYPLWNLKDRSRKLSEYRRLLRSQWNSKEEIEKYQLARLQELMAHAYSTVPFYRSRWDRDPVKYPLLYTDALSDFPLVTKQDVREYQDTLISDAYEKSRLINAKTGGSTGVALELFFDKRCQEYRNAAAMLADSWSGWKPGMLVAALWGTPPVPITLKEKVRNMLHDRTFYLDTMDLNQATMSAFVQKMKDRNAGALFGHAHSIYMLAQFIEANNLSAPKLDSIVSTSMMLLQSQRVVIESVFGVKVTNRYGCEEVGLVACECEEHSGLHINAEHVVVELLDDDGSPVPSGVEGRIVLTDLNNRGMPLVRYEVGDLAELSPNLCGCGRGYPLLSRIVGRTADYLKRRDGSQVSGISLVERTLTAIDGIEQLQIIQEQLNYFVLNVVAGTNYAVSKGDELVGVIKSVFGEDVEVRIIVVDSLSQSANGKYRFAICNIYQGGIQRSFLTFE